MRTTVITSSRSRALANGLTYEAPDTLKIGMPVSVPLRNTLIEGIILSVEDAKADEEFDIKEIKSVLHEKPLLSEPQLRTLRWMAEYYCCTIRSAMSVWLPPPPWSKLLPKIAVTYALTNPTMSVTEVRGKKQREIVDHLLPRESASAESMKLDTGASTATLRALLKAGVIREIKRQETFSDARKPVLKAPHLTPEQREASDAIAGDKRPSLLFGITGSGKTEVYADLITQTIESGKRAMLLVPEILLTEYSIQRFEQLLDREHIAVLHSRLTASERAMQWRRIHRGEVHLVIGSRSALFAPVPDLGLIILDEEHEWTYKNEQTPRYHARETAETLAKFSNAKLVLGTASPSLESWSRAKSGAYHLATLKNRYANNALPTVRIVDLKGVKFGSYYPFSPEMLEAIKLRLERKQQTVLFLNRRGLATALLCLECRRRVTSPLSQLPFTVHKESTGHSYLLDHTTGARAAVPAACPHCHSTNLLAVGAGTQKIETLLQRIFPRARILRGDSDTLESPEQMRTLLKKMQEKEADILLGTQSVVKGLDLPDVTLAGVLLADVGLSLPHFRAGERVFQLLTQLTGRSGRAQPGEVIIQTFRPDADEILLASKHEVEPYLDKEWKLRMYAGYPPAQPMVRFILKGKDAERMSRNLQLEIEALSAKSGEKLVIHRAPTLSLGAGWHVLVRGNWKGLQDFPAEQFDAIVDRDPIECI
ncbi:MAG TPA: primosomal protein N' [Candidatus Peribacteraceae bacterium]|nr:primosomal protein N' [Candidatus Peribacteraceae bacterium]